MTTGLRGESVPMGEPHIYAPHGAGAMRACPEPDARRAIAFGAAGALTGGFRCTKTAGEGTGGTFRAACDRPAGARPSTRTSALFQPVRGRVHSGHVDRGVRALCP